MNYLTKLLSVAFIVISISVSAQLPVGAVAPNWTLTDINGNTHTLYDYLDQGKTVVVDFSTTWCNPCWEYHESHELENTYDAYGPAGTDEMMIFFIEGDVNTGMDQLDGTTAPDGTHGDWITGANYPIIDLVDSNISVTYDYKILGFPTIYVICPDRFIVQVDPAAQHSSKDQLYSFVGTCGISEHTNNVRLLKTSQPESNICDNFIPIISIQNYGSANLTSFDVISKIDGNVINTYNWTGSLNTYDIETITLSEIDITDLTDGDHVFTYELTNPNGVADEDDTNNKKDINFNINRSGQYPVELTIKADMFPSQINWMIKKGNSTVATGNNYADTDSLIYRPICLDEDECYNFIIYDANNDGFTKPSGSVELTAYGRRIFRFTEQEHNGPKYEVEFCLNKVSVAKVKEEKFNIYPNPAKDNLQLVINNKQLINTNIIIYDIAGKLVKEVHITNDNIINIEDLNKGVYFIKINESVKKFIKE